MCICIHEFMHLHENLFFACVFSCVMEFLCLQVKHMTESDCVVSVSWRALFKRLSHDRAVWNLMKTSGFGRTQWRLDTVEGPERVRGRMRPRRYWMLQWERYEHAVLPETKPARMTGESDEEYVDRLEKSKRTPKPVRGPCLAHLHRFSCEQFMEMWYDMQDLIAGSASCCLLLLLSTESTQSPSSWMCSGKRL